MSKTRWGIMGTGRIAGIFCNMLTALEGAEIYAIASRTLDKAEAFAGKYQASKYCGSYEELAADPQVDIIYVATPIACHYDNVKLCLENGKHVLCEKALTADSAQAKELYALSREKNALLLEALWTKCQPVFRKVMEWYRDGKFGEIQAVEARFYTAATKDHRLIKYKEQGGVLFDLMIYPLMYACALLGYDPKSLHAVAVKGGDDIDIMESVHLTFADGAFAALTAGLSHERLISLYIQGTKGRLIIREEFFFQAQKAELVDWDSRVIETIEAPFAINGYEYEAMEAMKCLAEGKTASELLPMEDTIAALELLEKCKAAWERNN